MKGRRRRDDQWDEGPRDGQDAQGDTWSDGGLPEDWTRHRADGPGQPGQPAQPGQWQAFGGGGQGFGAGGYAESGYPGAPPPATSQEAPGAYDASGGSGGNGSYDGYGGPGGHAATGGYGSPGGYGASGGYGPPGGYGASGGYGAPDGYGAPGGYGGSGYADPGGQGYGYAGPLSGNAGYGGLEQSDGRYQNAGYGQPVQGFGETSAIAQYGRMSPGQVPDLTAVEYAASDWTEAANGGAPGTPRPYGRLSIFTLLEDKAGEFDRLAEQAAEGVRAAEPDTLVYVIHVVPKAPMQRIIYEIYRDRAAFQSHERQPHIQRFIDERKACVLATNIIDLRLKYAKVAALGAPKAPAPSPQTQQSQVPSALESAARAPSFSPHGTGYTEVGNAWSADGGRHSGSAQERWDQTSFQGGRYGETR